MRLMSRLRLRADDIFWSDVCINLARWWWWWITIAGAGRGNWSQAQSKEAEANESFGAFGVDFHDGDWISGLFALGQEFLNKAAKL